MSLISATTCFYFKRVFREAGVFLDQGYLNLALQEMKIQGKVKELRKREAFTTIVCYLEHFYSSVNYHVDCKVFIMMYVSLSVSVTSTTPLNIITKHTTLVKYDVWRADLYNTGF